MRENEQSDRPPQCVGTGRGQLIIRSTWVVEAGS